MSWSNLSSFPLHSKFVAPVKAQALVVTEELYKLFVPVAWPLKYIILALGVVAPVAIVVQVEPSKLYCKVTPVFVYFGVIVIAVELTNST